MQSQKGLWVALVAVAIIAVTGLFYPTMQAALGGTTNYDEVDAIAIKVGGANGTRLGPIIANSCTLLANFSITASTTRLVPCAVTGVVAGDIVGIQLAASSSLASQYIVMGASASTTAGMIDVALFNATGVSATPAATPGFGSSTAVQVLHWRSSVPGL